MENELREAGKAVWRATLEWKKVEEKERRETDAAGVGVIWKAVSGAQSSKAEIGPSRESGVGVNRKGSRARPKFHEQCWRFAEEEESSGAEITCGDAGLRVLQAE